MRISSRPESEWLLRRPLIEELYSVQGCTMDQVRDHLCQTGFHVNTRMVKNRLLKWNLHKKLSLIEVRTALELLGPPHESWPCEQPRFRIRCKVVSLDNLLRSCRRRGIHDPFDWIQSTPLDGPRSRNVEILPPSTSAGSESDVAEPAPGLPTEASESQLPQVTDSLDALRAGHIATAGVPRFDPPGGHTSTDLAINRMRDPQVYILAAQAIQGFRSYCLKYITLREAAIEHCEPPVHQFTSHGRLQNHIDEGVFQFVRNDIDSAFANFKLAFVVLEELLDDVHPMSIAQYLMLLCRLTANKASVVAGKLLKQALDLSRTRKNIATSLLQALQAIYCSGEFLEMPLLCLRAAVDCMEDSASWQWKSLYVKERYCHALFLAGFTGEGALRRAKLLEEQQSFYGSAARNVLWTALIVAEDCVVQCRLHEAECRFNGVLQQSECLSGFHRAKIRAVALSGLARIAIARARQCCDPRSTFRSDPHSREVALQELESAVDFVREALDLAEIWFDRSATRRVEVLRDLQAEALALSLQVGGQAE